MDKPKPFIEETIPLTRQWSIDEMLQEMRREIFMRQRVYPKLIKTGKLTEEKAQRQIELLVAATGKLHRYNCILKANMATWEKKDQAT